MSKLDISLIIKALTKNTETESNEATLDPQKKVNVTNVTNNRSKKQNKISKT